MQAQWTTKVMKAPRCIIIAGPNGAGKTTFARAYLPTEGIQRFVNADTIATGLSGFAPEATAASAARIYLRQLDEYASREVDFAFETTLSGLSYARKLEKWKAAGYKLRLIYLSLANVDLALNRIATRVAQGGHNVPASDVRRRFQRSLHNFQTIYVPLADSWSLYDNSGGAAILLKEGHS